MIIIPIPYTDYNGVQRNEKHMFNLNQAEMAEMELTTAGGMNETIKAVIEAQDTTALVKIFKDLILKSYGVKTPDGKRFAKSHELSTEFSQTEAYSKLFIELATNTEAASTFMNGIISDDVTTKTFFKSDTTD